MRSVRGVCDFLPSLAVDVCEILVAFCRYVGIFAMSLLSLIVYLVATCNKPQELPTSAFGPSIASGIVWALGEWSHGVRPSYLCVCACVRGRGTFFDA